MANQANIQQVRYDAVQPSLLDNLTGLANAAYTGYNQRKTKADDDRIKMLQSILPALAQQNRLNPAQAGSPGSFNYGGAPWSIGPAPVDYGNLENQQDYLLKKQDLENPDAGMKRKAMQTAFSDAAGPLGNGAQDILKAMQAYETMKTGVGPEEPGTPGKKGFLGFGTTPAGPITRRKIVGNKIVTEYQQPDGSWTSGGTSGSNSKAQGKIRVKVKSSGQTGTVDASEFDPKVYEKL